MSRRKIFAIALSCPPSPFSSSSPPTSSTKKKPPYLSHSPSFKATPQIVLLSRIEGHSLLLLLYISPHFPTNPFTPFLCFVLHVFLSLCFAQFLASQYSQPHRTMSDGNYICVFYISLHFEHFNE